MRTRQIPFLAILVGTIAAAASNTASACSKCETTLAGVDCVSDDSSMSVCQVKSAKSTCTWSVQGEADIDFGILKGGAKGGIKGKGSLSCTYEKVCEAIGSCQPKCGGGGKASFGSDCTGDILRNPFGYTYAPTMRSSQTDVYGNINASTAQAIISFYGAVAP